MSDGILVNGTQLWCSTMHNTQSDHNSFNNIYIYIYIYRYKIDGYGFFLSFYCFAKETQPISQLGL